MYIIIPVVFAHIDEFEYVYVNIITQTHLNHICRKWDLILLPEINFFLNPHSWIVAEKLNYVIFWFFSQFKILSLSNKLLL